VLEVEPIGTGSDQNGNEAVPALLQKHTLGGCTIKRAILDNCNSWQFSAVVASFVAQLQH